jgi:hypothetical protein
MKDEPRTDGGEDVDDEPPADGPADEHDEMEEFEDATTPEGPQATPAEPEESDFVEYGIEDKPPLGSPSSSGSSTT